MKPIYLYNTLSRKKEPFTPLVDGFVGMYVCGPTVYGDAHLGHAKSYVAFDLIARCFRYAGYKVRHVMNITDVGHLTDDADAGEDKLAKQALIEQMQPMEIAEKYTTSFFNDMDALGVQRPNITPRATGHIPEQIELIKALIAKGHAYESNGNVYFDVSSDPDYGKLSGRINDETKEGTRVEVAGDKRHPRDFALWKKAEESHLMKWPSPWGIGYPGWHVECSAMSQKYLGETFDIHGGGLENQFPHHECEIAQSECAHGVPFVKYWLHNNMVTLEGQKMGKSLGNAISLHQFFSGDHPLLSRAWPAEVIRFFLLQSHYRSTTDFSEPALEAAESGLNTLFSILKSIQSAENGTAPSVDVESLEQSFFAELADDFNSAKALAVLFEHLKPIRSSILKGEVPANCTTLATRLRILVKDVLGLWPSQQDSLEEENDRTKELMHFIIQLRAQARTTRNWALADQIRNELKTLGIQLDDTPEGTKYHFTH